MVVADVSVRGVIAGFLRPQGRRARTFETWRPAWNRTGIWNLWSLLLWIGLLWTVVGAYATAVGGSPGEPANAALLVAGLVMLLCWLLLAERARRRMVALTGVVVVRDE